MRILRQGTRIHRFRCAEEKGTEHQKTAFRFDGVRIPIFIVPLLDVFGALEGLQVGPGRALGRARRREERTLVLIWQGIARMDAGVDVGSAKWPQNRAQGSPHRKKRREKSKSVRISEIIKNQKTSYQIEPFQGLQNRLSAKLFGSLFELRFGTLLFAFFHKSRTDFGHRLRKPSFSPGKTKLPEALLGPLGPFVGPLERSWVVLGHHHLHLNSLFFLHQTGLLKRLDSEEIHRRP